MVSVCLIALNYPVLVSACLLMGQIPRLEEVSATQALLSLELTKVTLWEEETRDWGPMT